VDCHAGNLGGLADTDGQIDVMGNKRMSSVIENYVSPVVWQECGAQIQKPIAWFRENNEITCPGGTTIYLATDELIAIIDQLEGAIGRPIRPAPEG
jgi:hypothetical protein